MFAFLFVVVLASMFFGISSVFKFMGILLGALLITTLLYVGGCFLILALL